MKKRDLRVALAGVVAVVAAVCVLASTAAASTGIVLTAKDGSMIYARTMESGMSLQPNMLIVPRNHAFVGTGPNNTPGVRWTTKYGFVGPNINDQTWVCDGINEKGLAVGNFLFPGTAGYQKIDAKNVNRALASYEVTTYLLGTCANVQEAITALQNVRVCKANIKSRNFNGNWHYAVYDAAGRSAIIEYTDGQMNVQENPQGIVTNTPAFYWNLNGLRSYIQTVSPADAADQCVWQAFHLLNQFDVPVGMIRANDQGKWTGDYSNWTTAADMTHFRYYFRTFQNRQVKMVDLNKVDLNAKGIRTIPMQQAEVIDDVSGTLN
jgi:choloylglycine hydrolase